MDFVESIGPRQAVRTLGNRRPIPFSTKFPDATELSLDLLTKMLTFHPRKRITVEECLAHPWLAGYRDPSQEFLADEPFTFEFAPGVTKEDLQRIVVEESREILR